MCRLFATLADQPVCAPYYVSEAPQSLRRQSFVDEKRKQGDGWGVGWFDRGRPKIFKSPHPLYRDAQRVQRAEMQAKGHSLIGHVRWASNPLKLPRHELIGPLHTQPFSRGRWLFAHNGTLYIPREVAAELGPLKKWVRGRNDSEVLFYWLLKSLRPVLNESKPSIQRIAQAVRKSFQGLDGIFAKCRKKYPLYRYGYHGVNWLLSNGNMLLAFCFVDPKGFDRNRALLNRKEPYYQMRWQAAPGRVTVVSEPLDRETEWTPFRHGELLMAQLWRQRIKMQRRQVFP